MNNVKTCFHVLQIRSIAAPELCVDSGYRGRDEVVGLAQCVKGTNKKAEQNFVLTWHKDLRVKGKTLCFDVSDPLDKADVLLYPCHGGQGNQYWKYDVVRKKHILSTYM